VRIAICALRCLAGVARSGGAGVQQLVDADAVEAVAGALSLIGAEEEEEEAAGARAAAAAQGAVEAGELARWGCAIFHAVLGCDEVSVGLQPFEDAAALPALCGVMARRASDATVQLHCMLVLGQPRHSTLSHPPLPLSPRLPAPSLLLAAGLFCEAGCPPDAMADVPAAVVRALRAHGGHQEVVEVALMTMGGMQPHSSLRGALEAEGAPAAVEAAVATFPELKELQNEMLLATRES